MSNKNIVRNELVENNVDDVYSTYVKCDCGTEILEFQACNQTLIYDNKINDVTFTTLDDPIFELRYYGLLKRRDVKYGYNNFCFMSEFQLGLFINLLKEIINEENNENIDESFYDDALPFDIEKKYGRGGICVVHEMDDIFTYIQKYKNLEKKKKKKVSWEIVLRKDTLKAFVDNIEKIIEKVESEATKNSTGWIVASPEQIKEN